jgi:hypothetical protein
MEMLGWTYTEADWAAHVLAEKARLEKSELMRPPAALVAGGIGALVLALAVSLRAGTGPLLAALAVLLSLTLALWVGPRLSAGRHLERLRSLGSSPPRALFTSTGVVFGERAWLWRPKRGWLAHVEVVHGAPTYLLMRFVRRGLGPTTVRIPVPQALLGDVMEVAKLLENKIPEKPEL